MNDNTGDAVDAVRVEARLRSWFATEVARADHDLAAAPQSFLALRNRRRTVSGAAVSGTVVTVLLGIGIVAALGSSPGFGPGGNGRPPTARSTLAPTPPAANVTAWYPDGIPAAIDGEKVFRPDAVGSDMPAGGLLVGGWDFGPIFVSCPAIIVGQSPPWCPIYEGLAELKGGDKVLNVMWDQPYANTAPIVVVRVEVIALPSCTSTPAGGCPERPSVHASAFVWQGSPGP